MTGFVYYTILRSMIKNYKSNGYEIMTSKHPDYPDDIAHILHGYRPDVVASRNGSYIICDVETKETIDLHETIEHWDMLSKSNYPLHVALPFSCYAHAKSVADLHNIEIFDWWTASDL